MTMISEISAPATTSNRPTLAAILAAPILFLVRLDMAYRQRARFLDQDAARYDDMGTTAQEAAQSTVWSFLEFARR